MAATVTFTEAIRWQGGRHATLLDVSRFFPYAKRTSALLQRDNI